MVDKFYVDEKVHKLFRDLVDERGSPFFGMQIKDVFIFAMSMGFASKSRSELNKKKDIADVDVFTDNQLALIKSIAVKAEGKLEVLADDSKPMDIAEEYANGGIHILYEMVFKTKDDPLKNLDKKISSLTK